ncbi:hypothetical protein IEQ34_024868 [Dendrobium chrysotoxum]|uniref:Cytochrome b n=1 Tax=Dendrobium chrysotoxum TaxID=161865 RepID=A0AAV7FS86_DENCH|nr:hypothetical protein IEQ34_024868 [Dendrobium chrysotoxum]
MFSAILALLVMPFTDLSNIRGIQFRPLSKIVFYIFIANFLILMQLGAKHGYFSKIMLHLKWKDWKNYITILCSI